MELDNSQATIVSLLPYDLVELKPGLFPSEYRIRKADNDKPGLTIIPNDVHYLINADPLADAKESRNIKVPVLAKDLAKSIINDYANSLLAVSFPDMIPGLFSIIGNYSDGKEVAIKFIKELMIARERQNKWFTALVAIADDTWSKTRSPLGISDLQRFAAGSLKLKRDWLNPVAPETLTNCPVCKNVVNDGALKCVSCGFILNKTEYEKVVSK